MTFDRVAFVLMAIVALTALTVTGGIFAYEENRVLDLVNNLKAAKVENQQWLQAFQKLSERIDHSTPPRRPGSVGQVGDSPR